MGYYEHHKRSIAKALTFRAIVLLSDFTILVFITHRYDVALGVVILTNIASTVLYYAHERAWAHTAWGRQPA